MDAFEAKGEEIALSQEERAEYADLIKAGVIEDGADMAGWENSYQELAAGLEAEGLGRSMEDMGLPSSFSELKNMKDDRKGVKGFFSKLFRRPSPRAKAFETLAKAHYEVMSLGKTDVSDKLAAMKQRQEEHARKMTRAGRK